MICTLNNNVIIPPSNDILVEEMFSEFIFFAYRYVVRAKAGKKQSLKDASGRAAHSAGASLRRYNELALKKVSCQTL